MTTTHAIASSILSDSRKRRRRCLLAIRWIPGRVWDTMLGGLPSRGGIPCHEPQWAVPIHAPTPPLRPSRAAPRSAELQQRWSRSPRVVYHIMRHVLQLRCRRPDLLCRRRRLPAQRDAHRRRRGGCHHVHQPRTRARHTTYTWRTTCNVHLPRDMQRATYDETLVGGGRIPQGSLARQRCGTLGW